MKIFRHILILLMLVLVMVPSLSLSMHFCGGELENVSMLSIGHSCEMEQTQVPPCHQSAAEDEEKSCCQDQLVVTEAQDQISHSAQLKIDGPSITFITAVFGTLLRFLAPADIVSNNYHHYSPPLIERDIPVLVQSFLL